jgi:hypothetical protein
MMTKRLFGKGWTGDSHRLWELPDQRRSFLFIPRHPASQGLLPQRIDALWQMPAAKTSRM